MMENCLRHLAAAYRDLSEGAAVNRPRSDLYLPTTGSGGVYCFKTMEGALSREKVMALPRSKRSPESGVKKKALPACRLKLIEDKRHLAEEIAPRLCPA